MKRWYRNVIWEYAINQVSQIVFLFMILPYRRDFFFKKTWNNRTLFLLFLSGFLSFLLLCLPPPLMNTPYFPYTFFLIQLFFNLQDFLFSYLYSLTNSSTSISFTSKFNPLSRDSISDLFVLCQQFRPEISFVATSPGSWNTGNSISDLSAVWPYFFSRQHQIS